MRTLKVILILIVIATAASLLQPVQAQGGPKPVGLRPDAPTYALHGPFWVGTREFVIPDKDGKRPLPLTVWYPALNPQGSPEEVVYNYDNFASLEGFAQPGHALKDAAPDTAKGPYPLLILSHAMGAIRYELSYIGEHLASHGFVVMAVDHTGNTLAYAMDPKLTGEDGSGFVESWREHFFTRPLDIQRQIDYASVLSGKGGALDGTIAADRIAVAGHSSGAWTALASAGAQIQLKLVHAWCAANAGDKTVIEGSKYALFCKMLADSEGELLAKHGLSVKPGDMWPPFNVVGVDAIVPISSGDLFTPESLSRVTVPTLLMVGTQDSTGAYQPAVNDYESLPSAQKGLIAFENADHGFSSNVCLPWYWEHQAAWACATDSVWDIDRAHDLINHFTTAFLLDVLKGDKEAHKALLPDAVKFPGIQYKTTMK
jgi:predicted dienelactone hydrolase